MSKQDYRISIRGRIPEDITKRVTAAHAEALVAIDARNKDLRPEIQKADDGLIGEAAA